MAGLAHDPNTEDRAAFIRDEEGEFVQATSEGGDVTEVTFVDDCLVAVAVAKAQPPQDEYETDSEDDFSDTEGEDLRRLQFQDLDGQYAPRCAYSSQL